MANLKRHTDTTMGRLAREVVYAQDAIRTAIACLEMQDPKGALAILQDAENKRRSSSQDEGRT